MATRVIIMGAAGRDFHNFNTFFRDNPNYEVVCFTATQIPEITDRKYPAELAGRLYPKGIPIYEEKELAKLIKEHGVDDVVFSYSDVSHRYVMDKASVVNAAGANFRLLGADATMIKSSKPVIAVCAVRTGCGKSQTARKIVKLLKGKGKKIVAIRHPMPYGDLAKQAVQRFATYEDLDKHECTIEEREEYEPYIERGLVVYAGVDYGAILREAEKEADIILWDGGNNDFSFYHADLYITVADPLRVGHELSYYPGEISARMADVIIINKENSAEQENIGRLVKNIKKINPAAKIIHADSALSVDGDIAGKKALVVEDGPTTTHGGMAYGAGFVAAKEAACQIIDPRPFAVGSIKATFEKFRHLEKVLPAIGYFGQQLKDLEETINKSDAEIVVSGTPIDLTRVLNINKPIVRVRYDLAEKGSPNLEEILKDF
ncbi:MAG: GTPase [Candidatus Diapherotrites archaeon]|nr:GTPase [Candidatus Diapherotrites archaeon]